MTTIRVLFVMFCFGLGVGAKASDVNTAPDDTALRARISERRDLLESDFARVQQDCYARFAVSDCLVQARRERRAALDELRRQEVALNQQVRQAKALADLDRLDRKLSPDRP